jgi:sugar/nucleoside kinase (ribokinase family)
VPTRRQRACDTRAFDLLVIGEINPDIIVTQPGLAPVFGQVETIVEDVRLCPGSSSVITACGAARLGLRTTFAGVVGDDLFGRYMLSQMSARAVDTSGCIVDPARPTGISIVLNKGHDRGTLTSLGTIAALRADQVPRGLLQQVGHVHVGSYYLQSALRPDLSALLSEARAAGATTSVDCNWDPAERWSGIDQLLPVLDIFFLNEEEARRITGLTSSKKAARALVESTSPVAGHPLLVAVKQGARGALVTAAGDILRVPAQPMKVVDTTGAGDSFNAGFIYGWATGWDAFQCLRLAVACGSLSTRKVGGVESQPELPEALACLSRQGDVS